jgi:hypothetical protein
MCVTDVWAPAPHCFFYCLTVVGSNSYYRYSVQYEYSVWYHINKKESGRKAEVKILRFVLFSYTVLPVMSTM